MKTTHVTRKYDCINYVTHRHETAIIEFYDGQTRVTIHNAAGRTIMWDDDTTDASDVVNLLKSLYLRFSRVWD